MKYILNIHTGYVESQSNVFASVGIEHDGPLTDIELVKLFIVDYRSYFDNDLDTRECCKKSKKVSHNVYCPKCGMKLDSLQTSEEKAAEHFEETFFNGDVNSVGGEFSDHMKTNGWRLWNGLEDGNFRVVDVYYFEDMISGERNVERHLVSAKTISVEVKTSED